MSVLNLRAVYNAAFAVLVAGTTLLLPACRPDREPREIIRCGNQNRTALVHMPPKQDSAALLPLVVALHGMLNTPEGADKQTAFRELADREGFVVAYPDARMGVWNIFNSSKDADDVLFLGALIDQLVATHRVDPARVYLTGTSNGGMMVHTVARVVPERFAAIAPAFGPLARVTECAGPPGVPMPTLIIHGTADNILRWGGGGSSGFGLPWYVSVPEMVAFWANNNGCSEVSESANLPDIDPNDGTTASRTVYGGCTDGAEVVLYTVHGGGHNRPGTLHNPNGGYGAVCMDFNATEAMWAFFKTHSRTLSER